MIGDIVDTARHPLTSPSYATECRRNLDASGALVLTRFFSSAAIEQIVAESVPREGDAFYAGSTHNVYLTPPDPDLPAGHTFNRQIVSTKGLIADDQIHDDSPLRVVYENADFRTFLCGVLGIDAIHPYADELSSINVHFAAAGMELGWHFDNSSFAVTLLLQAPEGGGLFEYVPAVRNAEASDHAFAHVARILDGNETVSTLTFEPGDLVLFRGRNAMHRVTPTIGDTTRMLTVFAFNDEPGIGLSVSARQTSYGRQPPRIVLTHIWRYPVKSCGGQLMPQIDVQDRGLAGDRAWAVVDAHTGLVASAKRPGLWGALLTTSASLNGSSLTVSLPNGRTASSSDPGSLDAAMSSLVGRPVAVQAAETIEDPMLERTDPNIDLLLEQRDLTHRDLELGDVTTGSLGSASGDGTVFDFAPIHIISIPTLEALEASGATTGDPRRFRPNLIVDVDGPAFQENGWPGQQLHVGPNVVLDLLIQTPRCVVPSLAQAGLPKSVPTLRSIAQLNRIELEGHGVFSCVGAYANVAKPGKISAGDSTRFSAKST